MSPRPITFVTTGDPTQALTWFGPLIAREPVALSVIASVAGYLVADPGRYNEPRWWAGRQGGSDGAVVAAFMHTSPFPLHVGWATTQQAQALARELAGAGYEATGVGGEREPATAFAEQWVVLRGGHMTTRMHLGVYDLPGRAERPFTVSGAARLAEAGDVRLVDAWMRSFAAEVDGGRAEADPVPVPSQGPAVRDGRVLLWERDGIPVSMAYASMPSGGLVRVSGVWTPTESRRHGYASAVVAELSRLQQEAGRHCMLFTDLANPTSNAIYQAIGYRRIGENVTLGLD